MDRQNSFFSLFGLGKVNSDVMLNHNNFIEIRILATDGWDFVWWKGTGCIICLTIILGHLFSSCDSYYLFLQSSSHCAFARARAVTMTHEQLLLHYCFNSWAVNDIVWPCLLTWAKKMNVCHWTYLNLFFIFYLSIKLEYYQSGRI